MSFPVLPMHDDERPRTSKRKKLARLVVMLIVVAIVATGASFWWKQNDNPASQSGVVATAFAAQNDTFARAPTGIRVKVRVINTTKSDGLARRATAVLREHGFDVVDYEGDARKTLDSTLVLTHSGHPDWSARIVRVLGTGSVQSRPDSSRYIDLTVMLGRDWKAPAQPLRP